MIIPLFFDPSHEINLENNSKKDWILYRHSDILRPITTNRLSRYLRWMPYACGKSQECGISILNTTDTFEQSSTLWQIISHLTRMLTLGRLHHLDLEQHAIPCDILVNLAIVWSLSLSINNSHTFKKQYWRPGRKQMHEALAHDHFQTTCGCDRPTRRDCSYLYGCRRYTVIYISKPIPNSLNFRIEILPYSDCLAV